MVRIGPWPRVISRSTAIVDSVALKRSMIISLRRSIPPRPPQPSGVAISTRSRGCAAGAGAFVRVDPARRTSGNEQLGLSGSASNGSIDLPDFEDDVRRELCVEILVQCKFRIASKADRGHQEGFDEIRLRVLELNTARAWNAAREVIQCDDPAPVGKVDPLA